MDVAMSISSTIEEISYQNPELGIKGLFFSGMRVGKDMMGTMSNTLILAFAGGSINTLVFIYAYNYEYLQMINMFDIGIEIIQGVASSMGVILTVPICSFLSACIQGKQKKTLTKEKKPTIVMSAETVSKTGRGTEKKVVTKRSRYCTPQREGTSWL